MRKHAYIRPVHGKDDNAVLPKSLALCKYEDCVLIDNDIIEHFDPYTPGKEIARCAVELGIVAQPEDVCWAMPMYV